MGSHLSVYQIYHFIQKFSIINREIFSSGRVGVGILVGSELGGVGGVVGIEGKVGVKASLETESLNDYTIIDRQNFNCGFYGIYSGFAEGLMKLGPLAVSLGDLNFNAKEKAAMINMKAEINDKKTKSNLTTEEVEYVLEDENGNPLIDPWTGTPMIGTRNELVINSSLNFSKLETFFIFPKIDKMNQRPALRIYEGEIASGSGKFMQEIIDEELAADKTYKFSVNLKKAGLSEAVGVYEVVPCVYDKGSGMITEYRNNSMIVTPGTPIISQPKCYQWFGRELSVEVWEYYLEEYGEEAFKGKKREDFTEYAFTTVVELKNATRIKEWGMEFRLEAPDGTVILEKEYSIPFDGLCRAGKYTIITTFISEYRPTSPYTGVDALSVTAKPYCKYDGEKKRFARSKYINLYYPSERKGGPYIVGTSISQDL